MRAHNIASSHCANVERAIPRKVVSGLTSLGFQTRINFRKSTDDGIQLNVAVDGRTKANTMARQLKGEYHQLSICETSNTTMSFGPVANGKQLVGAHKSCFAMGREKKKKSRSCRGHANLNGIA